MIISTFVATVWLVSLLGVYFGPTEGLRAEAHATCLIASTLLLPMAGIGSI